MDRVRDVCSAALSVRKAQRPAGAPAAGVAHRRRARRRPRWRRSPTSIADEVNVKDVELTDDVAAVGAFELQVVPAALGPRLGTDVQQVIRAVQGGRLDREDGRRRQPAASTLLDGEYTLRLVADGRRRPARAAGQRRRRRARHRRHARARGRGPGPRPGPARAAGPPRRRPARQRPHPPDRAGSGGGGGRAGAVPAFVADEVLATDVAVRRRRRLAAGEVEVEVERA